jgi:hypothetical protein
MLRRLRSKAYYAAKRVVHATLLRFGLELNRAGTREHLQKVTELESTLASLEKQLESELNKAEKREANGAGGEQLESQRKEAMGQRKRFREENW